MQRVDLPKTEITLTKPATCGKILRSNLQRIINGENVTESRWPWVASIRRKNAVGKILNHFCGGTLITEKYILTAAHCFKSLEATHIVVMIANSIFEVDKLIVHNSYKFTTYSENDIALIQLKNTSNVLPICLPENKTQGDLILKEKVVVASFIDDKTMNQSNKIIQEADLSIISGDKLCEGSGFYDQEILYCVLDKNKTRVSNLCNGDSGSPLFAAFKSKWVLFGVASYVTAQNTNGTFECIPSLPSYFTKVAMYLDWINENIQKN